MNDSASLLGFSKVWRSIRSVFRDRTLAQPPEAAQIEACLPTCSSSSICCEAERRLNARANSQYHASSSLRKDEMVGPLLRRFSTSAGSPDK